MEVFGVRIVVREIVVGIALRLGHVRTDAAQRFRRKQTGGAVAAGDRHLHRARKLVALGEFLEIFLAKVLDTAVAATGTRLELRAQHDGLEPFDFIGAKSQGPRRAHLHTGPAIFVVTGCDHRETGTVERELREIAHRRRTESDVDDFATRLHQTADQRLLDRHFVGTIIVAGRDLGFDAEFVEIGAETQAHELHTHQVQLFAEQPARVVFAETVLRDQRLHFVFESVGFQVAARFVEHGSMARFAGASITAGTGKSPGFCRISLNSCHTSYIRYMWYNFIYNVRK